MPRLPPGRRPYDDFADDTFEDVADEAFEDLANEGALGALAGLARVGAGIGRIGAGFGRVAAVGRGLAAPLRTLGRIGAGAGRLGQLGRVAGGVRRIGRLPGLGRVAGGAGPLGRIGRLPGGIGRLRLPGRVPLPRIPGRAAARIPGRARHESPAGLRHESPGELRREFPAARHHAFPCVLRRAPTRGQPFPARARALAMRQLRAQLRAAQPELHRTNRLPPHPTRTPPQPGGEFREFRGWSDPVTMQQLLTDRRTTAGRALPPEMVRQFFRPGKNLYRVTVNTPSGPQQQYLNVGMTGKSVAQRMREHLRGGTGLSVAEQRLHDIMSQPGVDPSQISVQAVNLPDDMPTRLAHMYEIMLQHGEHVSDWDIIQNTRTFDEEDDEAANDAFSDLEMAG